MSSRPARRPLSGFERIMVESGPVMGADVVALRLVGEVGPDALGTALARVVARHPILRARVEGTPPAYVVDADPAEVSLEVRADGAWQALVAALVRRPFDLGRGGAIRAGWAPGDGGGTLVLAAHHALVDGPALFTLARDVLAALAGILTDEVRPLPPEVVVDRWRALASPLVRPLTERAWASGLRAHLRAPALTPRAPLRPGEQPVTLVAFAEGAAGSAGALAAAARAHDVTVGAAFFAALRLAAAERIADEGRDPARPLVVELQVGLRGRASVAPGPDDLGFAASGQRTRTALVRGEGFWGLAGRLHAQVRRGLDRGIPELAWQSVQAIDGLRAGLARRGLDLDPVGGTGLLVAASNVGRWPHATRWGDVEVTGVWGLCGVSYAGPSSLVWLRSLGDRWFVDATGSAPFHDQARLDALLGGVTSWLDAAAKGDPPARPGGAIG